MSLANETRVIRTSVGSAGGLQSIVSRGSEVHLLRIALATEMRIDRRTAWSGTIRYMADALRDAGADLLHLDPVWEWPTLMLGISGKLIRRLTGTDPMLNRSRTLSQFKARALLHRLRQESVDAIFAPVGSTLISEMPRGIPIIYTSDATMRLMRDYYDRYGSASATAGARAIASEAAALDRADLLIYPTQWAAQSAIENYGVTSDRIMVQPFGANMSDPPSREEALHPRRDGPVRLLFCGVEWKRKGGDIALAAVASLLDAGRVVELTILGCVPPDGALNDARLRQAVTVIPYLNKTIPAEREQFRKVFLNADILVLPTKAECFGLVFCEAAACGVVSLAPATGGIPEVICNGVTGHVLPANATGADYASVIETLCADPDWLNRMKTAARDDFEQRLNWDIWAQSVMPRIIDLSRHR